MTTFLTFLGALAGLALLGLGLAAAFTWMIACRVEALLPPKGRFVEVAGARLHVVDTGNEAGAGAAILMIHGLGGQLSHFTHGVAGRLERDFRVVAVDRPGAGYSRWNADNDAAGAGLSAQAAALAALIERLGLQRPLVVGHSLGGAVALTLALEHPQCVGGLALIAPLTHMLEQVPPVFKGLTIASPWLRRLVARTLAVPASIRNGRAALAQVFGPETAPADFATRGGALLGLRPGAFLAASSDVRAVQAELPALQARWRELRLPLRVLYGKDDRILDWRVHGQALADRLPATQLELVEGGHMLPVTRPDACAACIAAAARDTGTAAGRAAAGTAR